MNIEYHILNIELEIKEKILLTQWIESIIKEHGRIPSKINIIFCSDEYMLNLNREHLNHDYFTDIITFSYNDKNIISGDIFISIERVNENSGIYKVSVNEELKRVIIHGILHLIGFEDSTKEEKNQMRNMENFALYLVKDLKIL